jgi:hypothetical protein
MVPTIEHNAPHAKGERDEVERRDEERNEGDREGEIPSGTLPPTVLVQQCNQGCFGGERHEYEAPRGDGLGVASDRVGQHEENRWIFHLEVAVRSAARVMEDLVSIEVAIACR